MLFKTMGLRFNIERTETISVGEKANFPIDENVLERADPFKYLGSLVTKECKLDDEITARFQAASCAVGSRSPR